MNDFSVQKEKAKEKMLEAAYYVASGYSYRLVSTGTVYKNGSIVEQTLL